MQPEYQLKHRLAGAVIMVVVAVLVIPWVLSKPKTEVDAGHSTDASGKKTFRLKIEPQATTRQADKGGGQESAGQSRPALVADDKKTAGAAQTAASFAGWAVQVGTYAEPENINSILSLLAENGFNIHKTRVHTPEGKAATRIQLGPFDDKKTAEEVRDRVNTLTGEKAFALKPAP